MKLRAVPAGIEFNALRRARWNLGVLAELAEPGYLWLLAVPDESGQIVDFRCRTADPVAALALGCPGEDLRGRSFRDWPSMAEMGAFLFRACRDAIVDERAQVVSLAIGGSSITHHVLPVAGGVAVTVSCAATADRLSQARRVLHDLEAAAAGARPPALSLVA